VDLRDLLDVKAICDAGSFRKAAGLIGVSQPTLSNRIAYLEGSLGAPLFDRDRSRSRPTQLAEIIASRVTAIGQDTTLLVKEIARLASGRTGVVRIGFGSAPGRILLNDVVARITAQHPELSITLAFGSTSHLADQLLNRDLDIVVSSKFWHADPAILIEREIEVENIVVAHPKHAMFKGSEPDLSDVIRQHPAAITVLDEPHREIVQKTFGVDVNRLPRSVICSDFEMLIRLVTARPWYFTAGPVIAFAPELASGILRRMVRPVPFANRIAIHTNRDALSLPAVAHAQQVIRDVFTAILGTPAAA
jgi:DNA-binding transcriptional LysR family regulator